MPSVKKISKHNNSETSINDTNNWPKKYGTNRISDNVDDSQFEELWNTRFFVKNAENVIERSTITETPTNLAGLLRGAAI